MLVLQRAYGEVAEWSNASVLKTEVSQGTVSSNLTLSAKNRDGSGATICINAGREHGLALERV